MAFSLESSSYGLLASDSECLGFAETLKIHTHSIAQQAIDGSFPLTLLYGPMSSGKTRVLDDVANIGGLSRISIGLVLSKYLLDLPEREYSVAVDAWNHDTPLAVLDNLELLFEPKIKIDPVRWLQRQSRRQPVVAAWPGTVDGQVLTYAEAGHPEHFRTSCSDCRLINIADVLRSVS